MAKKKKPLKRSSIKNKSGRPAARGRARKPARSPLIKGTEAEIEPAFEREREKEESPEEDNIFAEEEDETKEKEKEEKEEELS